MKIYRERKGLPEEYTAKQFFNEVLFPLFFDDEKHLMHVHGSSFFQKVPAEALKNGKTRHQFQLERLHENIKEKKISGSTYVGYAAGKITQPTSGQLTSIDFSISSEEMYASWIGQGLSIGLKGGCILLSEEDVLLNIFEGWRYYRKYLNQTPNIKDKQIETWNGHWLFHSINKNFEKDEPDQGLNLPEFAKVQGKLSIPTIEWIKIILALSIKFPVQTLTAYAYSLSDINTTFGFINLYLPKVRRLIRLKEQLYRLPEDGRNDSDFEVMYSTFYNFKNACMLGTIGLKALEPAKLRKFMPSGTAKYAKGNDYRFADTKLKRKKGETQEAFEERLLKAKSKYSENLINFRIYKIWIIAMLNNKKELNALAEQVAQALIDFENQVSTSGSGRGKSTPKRLSDELKASKSLKFFIENLTALMAEYKESAEVLKKVKDAVIELPGDLFPLFVTLIRFEYQFKKSI